MTLSLPYNDRYEPLAPVPPILVSTPCQASPGVLLRAIVDTGADVTAVPSWLPSRLRLRPIDAIPVSTPIGTRQAPVVAIHVRTAGDERTIHALAPADEALVGRDLLRGWLATLDGPAGHLDIAVRSSGGSTKST